MQLKDLETLSLEIGDRATKGFKDWGQIISQLFIEAALQGVYQNYSKAERVGLEKFFKQAKELLNDPNYGMK